MKFTLSWLKEHLDTDATLEEIVAALTRVGLEVEGVHDPAAVLAPFRIARVLSAAPHPQADKLQVLSVDAGEGPVQVVCGAPNARAGLVGVFGPPGAYVPGSDLTLKVAAIRGVESHGMMCSVRELELGDEHDGIIELVADAPVGAAYAAWAGLDDPVIDIAVTPNRQDCMGVRGIARDLAAAGLGQLKPLTIPPAEPALPPCPVEIRTDDPEGCPAFYGRVIRGVRNGAAPEWMRKRLNAVGQRSISAIVDITNYVMLDLGRPSHAYDLAKLTGAVVARRAHDGETVSALNGKAYPLGAALALASDARTRFERGVDPAFLDDAVEILTGMIVRHCGGAPSAVVRAGQPPVAARTIAYDPGLCARLGGLDVAAEGQRAILARLGFAVDDGWTVRVPSWRRDVDGPADLVEEVIRIAGIDKVPATPLPRADGVARPVATAEQLVERRVRRTAAARGLNEAITWSFLSESDAAAVGGGAWTLANPISEELKVMRPSLLPGLLAAARRNLDRGAKSVRLFELGRRYLADRERPTVAFVLAGERSPRDWRQGKAQAFDAHDGKADALALLEAAGAPVDNLQVMAGAAAAYHPGQSATLRLGPKTITAEFGTLHPELARRFGLDGPVVAGELFLDAVPARRAGGSGRIRPAYAPPALQPVTRDFAFLIDIGQPADALVRAVRGADKTAITGARAFDVFTGTGVPDGQKSLAIEVTLQPQDRSFTDADLAEISARIVAAAARLGATLRG